MSQNVYQFIDLQRVDPPKKPLKIIKLNLLRFTSRFQKAGQSAGRPLPVLAVTRYCEMKCGP